MKVKYIYLALVVILLLFYGVWNMIITSNKLEKQGKLELVHKREKWIVWGILWISGMCFYIGAMLLNFI